MGYGLLEVSQVGPAEYPLIGVLHQSIFGRPGDIAALRGSAGDLLTLIAHLEGNPVGYLVASGVPGGAEFTVDSIAVLPDYQRQGLAARMLDWAEQHARARGYRSIVLRTPRPCPPAAGKLAERHGFRPDADGSFTRPLPPRQPAP
jgi:GNAT superfamily N-acetyltransferase